MAEKRPSLTEIVDASLPRPPAAPKRVMGAPLPPPRPTLDRDGKTPPEPVVARRPTPQGTPAIRDLPPVSTPIPDSPPAPVSTPSIPVKIDRKGLRLSWSGIKPWLPYVGFALFGTGGWMAGMKLAGLTVAAVELRSLAAEKAAAKATEDANAAKDAEVKFEAKMNGKVGELAETWKGEADANRAERATALQHWRTTTQDLEEVKKRLPSIQGLPPRR